MYPEIPFSELILGTLAKVKEAGGSFWHLTWKEKQKTITRYIRLNEVKKVQKGIKAYKEAKATIDRIARTNLNRLFQKRGSK